MKIKSIVSNINFETRPTANKITFSKEEVEELEKIIGASFPDEFSWYMQHTGGQKIEIGHLYFALQQNDYYSLWEYKNFTLPVFFSNDYNKYSDISDTFPFPYHKKLYVPFSSADFNSGIGTTSCQLFVSLNQKNFGTVWKGPLRQGSKSENNQPPGKIADSFTKFLGMLNKNNYEFVRQKQEDLFFRLFQEYSKSGNNDCVQAQTLEELFEQFFSKTSSNLSFCNKARNLQYTFGLYSVEIRNLDDFKEKADTCSQFMSEIRQEAPHLNRKAIKAIQDSEFYNFNLSDQCFFSVIVESLINEKLKYKEMYLVYSDNEKGMFSLVRRLDAEIKDVQIKGIGTFAYDSTQKWQLKRKKKPVWCEVPASLQIYGEENALTGERIEFVKEIFARKDLKPHIENYIFNHYIDRDYADYLSWDKDEQSEYQEDYPIIKSASEIWRILGSDCRIYVKKKNSFEIHFDYSPDDEHGLDIKIENWVVSEHD